MDVLELAIFKIFRNSQETTRIKLEKVVKYFQS